MTGSPSVSAGPTGPVFRIRGSRWRYDKHEYWSTMRKRNGSLVQQPFWQQVALTVLDPLARGAAELVVTAVIRKYMPSKEHTDGDHEDEADE